jgi:thiol:disulfide interchange protein
LPKPLPELELVARRTDQLIELTLRSAQLGVDGPREVYFFSEHEGVVESSGAQQLEKSNGRWRLLAPIANQASGNLSRLRGVLVADTAWPGSNARAVSIAAPVTQVAASELKPILSARGGSPSGANFTLLAALAFGFAGGVILNLMPCVLPVVSLKVLGFAQEREQARSAAWLFALGILVSFWMLAAVLVVFRAAGETLGWGFQLQTPAVVAALAMLFFALALNLSGVFEFAQLLPDRVLNSQFKHPHANAFFNGVLACVVATPCTAPFMGAALGFAATQSAVIGMAVFTAVAAGMAAPYVLLAHLPGLLKFLPKPGAWLTRFKQLLAFPLYASVVWLGWVLGQQAGVSGVIRLSAALVALALAVWFLSLWQKKSAAARWPALAALAGTLVIAGPLAWQDSSSANAGGARQAWEQYSKAKIETALQLGKPVFIDFTAAWCVTCQVNKRLVLETDSVRKAFVARGVALFRADWTKRDAEIEEALRQLGRNGVPVYVLLRTGREPLLLPELLRERYVMDALAALAPAVRQARAK